MSSRSYPLLRVILGLVLFLTAAHAQLGTGWVPTNFTKSVHLDNEEGLQTFSWSSFRQVGTGTPCADYSYDSETDTETFRIFDSRSNRSEIRLQNNYSAGRYQFEGYLTFSAPLHDESLFQIFGNTGSSATFLMMRGYRDNGGEIRVMGGSHRIASGVYGKEVRINIIHESNVSAKFYVNGVFVHEKVHNDPGVENYWKYGCYGTTNGNVPAVVQWRRVRTWKDGQPPGAEVAATPGRLTLAQGSGTTTAVNVSAFGANTLLSLSGLPAGATASFAPATVPGGEGSSTLTINTTPGVAPGSYPLTLTATGGGNTRTATLVLGVIPQPWRAADIGGTGQEGGTGFSGGVFTVNGSGSDIWGSADKFHFAHQTFTGDFTMTARVDSQQNTNGWAKSGLMIRESTESGARFAAIYVTPPNGVSTQYRAASGGNVADLARVAGLTAPQWLRLVRSGNTITGFRSADGTAWSQVGTTTLEATGEILAGLAVTSHNDAVLNATNFSNVTMPANFGLSPTPASRSVLTGQSTTYTVALASWNGFAGSVTLAASELPPGVTASFNPPAISGSGTSVLTLTSSVATPSDEYTVTLTGTNGGLQRSATVALTVNSTANLLWNSTSGTAWDAATANWLNETTGIDEVFLAGRNVVFTDRSGVVANIVIAANDAMAPGSLTVNATTTDFTIGGAGKITGSTGLLKTGTGTLTLTGTNDYTGTTTLGGGVLSVPALANSGTPSPMGTAGLLFDGGTLRWTGSANASTNRGFTLTPKGGTIEVSPPSSAGLTFNGSMGTSGSGTRTLTLAGTEPNPLALSANTLGAIVANGGGGATSLRKTGSSAWSLTGANTYSGGTFIDGGRLRAATSTSAFGSGAVNISDGAQAYLTVGSSFANAFFIEGDGVTESAGRLGALRLGSNGCNLTGPVTLTGNSRITAFGASGTGATISGKISGAYSLEFGNATAPEPIVHDLTAAANAFVFRGAATTDQDESQALATKRIDNSNARLAYLRFNLGSLASYYSAEDLTSVTLRLHLVSTEAAETVRVYGLRDTSGAGTADSVWTAAMTWNEQPARTTAPNDIPNSGSALPNANTTVLLGSKSFTASPGEVQVTLDLAEFRSLFAADTNQQVTLLFHTTTGTGASSLWAALGNSGGQLPPTLQVSGNPTRGNPGIITLTNGGNDWSGDTVVSHGTLKMGTAGALPEGEETGDVVIHPGSATIDAVLDLNGFNTAINGLSSTGATPVRGIVTNNAATAATLTLGNNDASDAFHGVIRNGTGILSIVKSGTGTQTLGGANTNTGPTSVNAGTLLVNGALGTGVVTVQSGATLGGGGALAGSLVVNPGGTLSPGSGIGTMTVNQGVTLQGTTFIELNKAAAAQDRLQVNAITYGGTLALVNFSGAFAAGDSFPIFNAGSYAGAFASLSPAFPAVGLLWDTSALSTNGTLKVVAATPIQIWRQMHFGTPSDTGAAADLANPTGDGVANLLKYALGMDPALASPEDLPQAFFFEGKFGIRFHRNPAATDLTYTVAASEDLADWQPIATRTAGASAWIGNGSTVSDLAGEVTVVDLASPAPSVRYLRLVITRPGSGGP